MFERIIEIIVYVISELRQNKNLGDVDIKKLHNLGYTNAEISTAFSWLADRNELGEESVVIETVTNPASFRVLHESELELFTKEAYGEMIQLHALKIITNEHIEMMLERAMMLGGRKLDSESLKLFVASMVFNIPSNLQTGSRIMLNGSDSVN